MREYKFSRYNLVVQETQDKTVIYNTKSLNWISFNRETFNLIKSNSNIPESVLKESYIKMGFVVPAEVDEIHQVKEDVERKWAEKDFLNLMIFVTMACDYKCVYCFEKEHLCNTEHMSKGTADDIIAFIERRYNQHKFTNKLNIGWIGGEPLLNMPIIRYISKELKSRNIEFNSQLYTNGRLLTKETALELKELGINGKVVIPIDGLAPTYSKLKKCKEDDFHAVIENIKNAEDILKIQIQINVSEASKKDTISLYKLLREEYGLKCKIILQRVTHYNSKQATTENNISFAEFYKIKEQIFTPRYFAKSSGCEAKHPNFYAIGVHGETYICEHLVGYKQYITGYIKDYTDEIDRKGTIWDIDEIIKDCHDCIYLPLCLGGCTATRHIDKGECHKPYFDEYYKPLLMKLILQQIANKKVQYVMLD